jgi:hypothetical protein
MHRSFKYSRIRDEGKRLTGRTKQKKGSMAKQKQKLASQPTIQQSQLQGFHPSSEPRMVTKEPVFATCFGLDGKNKPRSYTTQAVPLSCVV